MSVITFRDLSLLEAERQLAGRCLTNERLLKVCLEDLPVDAWRSEQGQDLSRIFYALAGRLGRGAYNPETNEDDLAAGFTVIDSDRGAGWWEDYLDELWCPWMAVDAYVAGLVDSLLTVYRLRDNAVRAYRAVLEKAPLQVDTSFDDELWFLLRDVIARRRNERYRRQSSTTPDYPPSAVDWEALRQRATR